MSAPHLHEFLTANRREILDRSQSKLERRDALTSTTVEPATGLPAFLDQMIVILRASKDGRGDERGDVAASAKLHGGALLRRGLTLGQVVQDYGSICQSITEMADERSVAIAAAEFHTFNRCFDEAVAQAVTEYERQRDRTVGGMGAVHLGFLAHEMRNLLTAAVLTFELVKKDSVEAQDRAGASLGRSLRSMRILIDRTLSEVRLGAQLRKLERLSLYELIDEVELVASLEAESRDLQISVDPGPRDVTVEADHQLLASAVMNVLQNAFKFTRPRSHVSIRVRSTDDRAFIEVQDECGGLPPGKTDEMFRPFEQRSVDRTGLGLGLSVSLKAVRACRGDIHISDLPGQGCVFTVELPRAR